MKATKTSTKHQSTASRPSKFWGSEQFISVFEGEDLSETESRAVELMRKKKVLDVFVTPGTIIAKIQDEKGALNKVSLEIDPLEDETWDSVFQALARTSYYPAKLIAGELPPDIEEVFSAAGSQLFPQIRDDIRILYRDRQTHVLNDHIAALVLRIARIMDDDPFTIFLWRGKGRDETLATIRNLRRELKKQLLKPAERTEDKPLPTVAQWSEPLQRFWSAGEAMYALEYRIKADELPAAILKWLDPLPLAGLEDDVEFALEEAYAKVARRAQAYGIGL